MGRGRKHNLCFLHTYTVEPKGQGSCLSIHHSSPISCIIPGTRQLFNRDMLNDVGLQGREPALPFLRMGTPWNNDPKVPMLQAEAGYHTAQGPTPWPGGPPALEFLLWGGTYLQPSWATECLVIRFFFQMNLPANLLSILAYAAAPLTNRLASLACLNLEQTVCAHPNTSKNRANSF